MATIAAAGALTSCTSGQSITEGTAFVADGTDTADVSATDAAAPATDAPSTSQLPSPASDAVRQAVLVYWLASHACGQDPKACQPASFTAAQGSLRATVDDYRAQLLKHGEHLGEATDGRSYVAVRAVLVDASATTATTDECVLDASPLLGPAGTDGQPTASGADSVSHRIAHTMYLEAGTWKPGEETTTDQEGAADRCGDTPDTVPPATVATS